MLSQIYSADQRNDNEQRSDNYNPQQREGSTLHDPITVDSRDDDHQSLALLNHSFDTLSDTGTFRLSPCKESDLRRSFEMSSSPMSSNMDREPSELGDISPIKVTYGNGRTQPLFGETSVMPETDEIQPPPPIVSYDPMRVLHSVKHVFIFRMKYSLASLQTAESVDGGPNQRPPELSENNKIALRRVEAAICAFGGQVPSPRVEHQAMRPSIFRAKDQRQHYRNVLKSRYKMKGSEIQWDVEENPPVEIFVFDSSAAKRVKLTDGTKESENSQAAIRSGDSPAPSDGTKSPGSQESLSTAKMKYHCKRCGQLKQNHHCPYRQPLQRSIGVMVFPAVNSYTAAEPGTIAAPLTKMNNFVSYDSAEQATSPKSSSNYCESTTNKNDTKLARAIFPNAISPENQPIGLVQSPQSSLSIQSSEDREERGMKRSIGSVPPANAEGGASLFVETVALKPEHYRAVTPMEDAAVYEYPVMPISFAERKRLSDTLFFLSKDIPPLLDDCAVALRNARQCFEWDLAVSQLLTQVIIGLYCAEGDVRLDGLQKYLLLLGVSC